MPSSNVASLVCSPRSALQYVLEILKRLAALCVHQVRRRRPTRDSNSATLDHWSPRQREGQPRGFRLRQPPPESNNFPYPQRLLRTLREQNVLLGLSQSAMT